MNKQGTIGSQMVLVWFIFILALLGGGIVIGSYLFIGNEFDFRQIEADMLNAKIRTCFSEQDFGDLKLLSMDKIYEKCSLNSDVILASNKIKICKFDRSVENCLSGKPFAGVGGAVVECGLKGANEKFAKCSKNKFSVKGEEFVLITVSNQHIRRAL